MTDTLLFSQQHGIAKITFNNPAKHNALGSVELAAIESALDDLDAKTRVLLIHAQGDRTFCAGADLAEISSGQLSGARFQAVTNRIAASPVPTIALLNGNVFGGGVELALSCDFRIGVTDTIMRIPAAALGLCYPPDGIRRIVGRLGVPLAKRLLLGAEEFTSEQMLALGIVDQLLPRADALTAALDYAARVADLAPLAIGAMLKIIRSIECGEFDAEQAKALEQACANSSDLQEGLLARREKRAPRFSGR